MNALNNDLPSSWWAQNLEDIDREIARLAMLCQVKLFDPGVIGRVLHKDASVCGTRNEIAFAKLRDMLMFHLVLRQNVADTIGQMQTAQIEEFVVEQLRKSFPALAAHWPPM